MRIDKRHKRSGAIKRIRSKFGYHCKYEVLLFVSNRNIYAQLIDFENKKTLCSVSTVSNGNNVNSRNIANATKIGAELAKKYVELKISEKPSFNRAEKVFHGIVKAVADGFYSNI